MMVLERIVLLHFKTFAFIFSVVFVLLVSLPDRALGDDFYVIKPELDHFTQTVFPSSFDRYWDYLRGVSLTEVQREQIRDVTQGFIDVAINSLQSCRWLESGYFACDRVEMMAALPEMTKQSKRITELLVKWMSAQQAGVAIDRLNDAFHMWSVFIYYSMLKTEFMTAGVSRVSSGSTQQKSRVCVPCNPLVAIPIFSK